MKEGLVLKKYKNTNIEHKTYLTNIIKDNPQIITCKNDTCLQKCYDCSFKKDNFKLISGAGKNAISTFEKYIFGELLENELKNKEHTLAKLTDESQKISIKEEIKNLEYLSVIKKNLFNNIPKYLQEDWQQLCNIIIAWGCTEILWLSKKNCVN